MDDLVDGTLNGFSVSILIERDAGGKSYGAHCCPYGSPELDEATHEQAMALHAKCDEITDACDGLRPAAAVKKAILLGFVPSI